MNRTTALIQTKLDLLKADGMTARVACAELGWKEPPRAKNTIAHRRLREFATSQWYTVNQILYRNDEFILMNAQQYKAASSLRPATLDNAQEWLTRAALGYIAAGIDNVRTPRQIA